MDAFYTVLGAVGAALILFGFYRVSVGKWTGKSLWFELDNLLGSSLMILYSIHLKAYIATFLNVVWATVAFVGVTSIAQRRNKPARKR